ncbi:MAG: heme-binding domain-containing protein [Bergeyella sp.]
MIKKIIYWLLVIIALIQFIPVDRTNKPVKKNENFADVMQTPQEIRIILKKTCYDCHSNETVYPDYAYFAPISWSVKHHVKEGREHLNFSEWTTFNPDLKQNMLENTIADIQQNRMPIAGYVAQHPEARLTDAEKVLLVEYFERILKSGKY